ncbi:hypothetical protein ACFW4O_14520 [Streptomyces mutabilis]|uniref:hypothetical protein n=1 Tax=Streptomyces TaxID=1883 RepID=UPI000BD1552C|nr:MULTISPECIES: hypothetical protein [unclassified Streptomyces]MDN3248799.1 hypothetical protein [Streptomyces sp. ZSW22]MDN3257348.1 hypothetical protein [Streptomyces sp. MA25(2023)]MDQ0385167.1 hypothetical protein [Streptomyces sp. DSM 42143]PAK26692.1 hypothetical protein CJD44_09020 [Streptomyces sp. alain-838]
MGTKTVDETGVKTDEHKTDEAAQAPETIEAEKSEGAQATPDDATTDAGAADDADSATTETGAPTGVGQGAGAVVSAGLGIVSLTGSWVGTVASARESLIGQLQTSSSSNVGTLIEKGYGNAWHATALWGGAFALVALIVGVVVLARPAFGAPGRPQAPWIKSVAWAGVALGIIGLLLAVLKYTDILLGLPSTG